MRGYTKEKKEKVGMLRSLTIILISTVLLSCDIYNDDKKESQIQSDLKWNGQVFSLLQTGPNEQGLYELSAIDHALGVIKRFSQDSPRKFKGKEPQKIGFHPGVMVEWPKDKSIKIFAAEGDHVIKALDGDFNEISSFSENMPRYVTLFEWPLWGQSVAVSPYLDGYMVLLKEYDPLTGRVGERIVIPFSESANTLRGAEKVTVGDINGDGVDDLIVVFSATSEVFAVSYPGPSVKPEAKLLFKDRALGMPNQAQIFDIDGDGDNDIILPDEASTGKIYLLMNDGLGSFVRGASIDFPNDRGVLELRIAKDNDGLTYILAAGYGYVTLYQKPINWKPGEEIPSQKIVWEENLSLDMLFSDIDGDGWLDGVIGKYNGENNIWVVYGPLWQNFKQLSDQHFVLK